MQVKGPIEATINPHKLRIYLELKCLGKQVSLHCAERGRLMADLWTSNADMTSRVIQEMEIIKEESEATAKVLVANNIPWRSCSWISIWCANLTS